MSFLLSHYRDTLEKFLKEGYKVTDFSKEISGKQLILRHDVDDDIMLINNTSIIEKELEVHATYFVRLHAVKYNLLAYKSLKMMEKIVDRGQEIGFHIEPTFIRNTDFECYVNESMEIFKKLTGIKPRYFSFHEPVRTGIETRNLLPEMNRSFDSEFYTNFKYLSDSGGRWREGCFSEHINKWKKLIVLTHPYWWYHETSSENY